MKRFGLEDNEILIFGTDSEAANALQDISLLFGPLTPWCLDD